MSNVEQTASIIAAAVAAALSGSDVGPYRTGYVTSVSPLRVQFPGDVSPVPYAPRMFAPSASVGDVVLTTIVDGAVAILAVRDGGVPPGTVWFTASALIPFGWIRPVGGNLLRADYPRLFSWIGTTWGAGDGSTTFGIPSIRDQFVMAAGTGWTLGNSGGEATHVLTAAEMPAHQHTTLVNTSLINSRTAGGAMYNVDSGGTTLTGSAGGGAAHNNLPPYVVLHAILKT